MPKFSDIHAVAREYLARGWSVIPMQARGKRPLVGWREFQGRLPTEAELAQWFDRDPDANIGIVTGRISGLVVLDVDPSHGGEPSLAALEATHGTLPRTVEALTGGGGRHLYFGHPSGSVPTRVGIAAGIDVRAEGGCVVAPPSLHASGRRYRWAARRAPGQMPMAELPSWLLALMRRESAAGHPLGHWRQLVRDGVSEGARNSTIASLTGHLLHHEIDAEVVRELMLAWNRARCRPPLPDAEVNAVVESIIRLHLRETGN